MGILKFLKKSHKWIALLVGIQLFLWISSGIVFSFINHDEVNGQFIYKKNQKALIKQTFDYGSIIDKYPAAVQLTQLNYFGVPFVKINTKDKAILIEAATQLEVIVDEELIEIIAERYYSGGGIVKSMTLEEDRTEENRDFSLPTWKIIYDDKYGSHIYFSGNTGEYQGIRTSNWRIFDFFMMLHFMDYGQRGNFNHGLIIFAGIILLLFSTSGAALVYSSFSKKDFAKIYYKIFSESKIKISMNNPDGSKRTIKTDKDTRLIDALAEQNIELESICGGGGICGCCRIKVLSNISNIDLDNHDILDEKELADGYRLACQLNVEKDIEIKI